MIEKNEGRSEETIGGTKEMFSAMATKVVKIRVALTVLELPSRCRKTGCTLANVFAGKISMSSNTSRDVYKIFLIAEVTSDHFRESKGRTAAEIMQQTGGLLGRENMERKREAAGLFF